MQVSKSYLKPEEKLITILMELHKTLKEKQNQSIRGGTEFPLFGCGYKNVVKNVRLLHETINNGLNFQGIWSSYIPVGGYRVKHNHPKGKISGCWYLDIGQGSPLFFNDGHVIAHKGDIVMFPSNQAHWVEKSAYPRLTIAFDMV